MLIRLILAALILLTANWVLGAAVTISLALLLLIIAHARLMVWEAHRRNDRELQEFTLVNNGQKEPDPDFLLRVWS